jgi:hypothetical protein
VVLNVSAVIGTSWFLGLLLITLGAPILIFEGKSSMPEANLFLDKRQHSRVPVKIPIHFHLMEDSKEVKSIQELGARTKPGQTMDTSLGGMYIVADAALKPGDLLSLKISIPSKPIPLPAFAEVKWSNATGAGISFLSMKEADQKLLETYLKTVEARR